MNTLAQRQRGEGGFADSRIKSGEESLPRT